MEREFAISPHYISSTRNETCDKLPMLSIDDGRDYAKTMGTALLGTLGAFQWFLSERIRLRSLSIPPDSPERVKLITQIVEKRIVRETPKHISDTAIVSFMGWERVRGLSVNLTFEGAA